MIWFYLWWFALPTKGAVLEECQRQGLVRPDIVTKQAILETGNFSSDNCIYRNNLFGMRHKSQITKDNPYGYFKYDHWKESVTHYKTNISSRHIIGEDYYLFLERIGYAEAKNYTEILRIIKI